MWYSFPFNSSLASHIAVFGVTLHFETSDHPFPAISLLNIHPLFMKGSPLCTSDFISVVWFTPKPCGTHFLLPHHLAYILQFLESPSILNPPTILFPQFHLEKFTIFYTVSPPPHVGLHSRRLVHPKTVFYSFPLTPSLGLHITVFTVSFHFEPSDHPFPPLSPQNFHSILQRGPSSARRTLSPSSGSPQNRVVLISFYPITWLTYYSL